MKRVIGFLLATTVLASLASAQGGAIAPHKAAELAFTVPGQGQKLLSQYRGKVIALGFISTTCPHCQAASKEITKFQEELGKRGFQAIDLAINALDNGGDADAALTVSTFAKTYEVGFPVGYVTRAQMMSFMGFSAADRMVVPQIALIDRKGVVRYQTPAASGPDWDAVMKSPNLKNHIDELMAESATSTATRAKGKILASAKK